MYTKGMKRIQLRTWISVATLLLIVVILFFSRKELQHAWELTANIDWWVLLILVPVIMIGHLAAGEMTFSYLRQKKLIGHVNLWTQMRISLELNFVNHVLPSGGVSGLSYMNWRLGKFGVSAGKATMAQGVRYVTGFAAMAALLVAAMFWVTLDNGVNRWLILMSSTLVSVMIIAVVLLIALFSNVARMHRIVGRIVRGINKLIAKVTIGKLKHAISPTKTVAFLDDIYDDYRGLMRDKRLLIKPFLWGLFFTATEIAIFWIVFWGLSTMVNPAPILIAYGLASVAGFVVVTPGGAGAYEAVMVLVLAIAGMSQGEAIAGIVLTRVIILLVTIVVGWILYQQVVMKYGKRPNPTIQR